MNTRIKILESYNYCPAGNTSQLCGSSISWQRGEQILVSIIRVYMYFLNYARYTTGHIWACPPSEGDDYIFHCHPPDQKIPKPKRLQEWYKKMLDKSVSERIVHDYKVCEVYVCTGGGLAQSCLAFFLAFCVVPDS